MYRCISIAIELSPSDDDDDVLTSEILRETSQLSIKTTLPVINQALVLLNQSPIPHKKSGNTYWLKKKVENTSCALHKSIVGDAACHSKDQESQYFTEIITQLKEKYKEASTSTDMKYQILTLLPKSWSVSQVVEEMGTTEYMAKVAKQMVQNGGILSSRPPPCGTNFHNSCFKPSIRFFQQLKIMFCFLR